jgi:hypothetical protein
MKTHNKALLSLALAAWIPIGQAYADEWWKRGALTCDESDNLAMVRLSAGYNDDPIPQMQLPSVYSKYAKLNSLSVKEMCTLKDGRRLSLSYETGQAFAYGMGRGDPPAYFTFRVDDKNVYYKKIFYGGYGSFSIDPLVLVLDGSKLISCKGPENSWLSSVEDFKISPDNCKNVSDRLSGNLKGEEFSAFTRDQEIHAYEVLNRDPEICAYFRDQRNIKEATWGNRDKNFEFFDKKTLSKDVEFGLISKTKMDVDNDGKKETVYRIHGYAGYFDGSYFLYFDDKKDEDGFLECISSVKCPEGLSGRYLRQNVEYITDNVSTLWPSAHAISARSLEPSIAGEYRVTYTWIYPVHFNGKTYFYFDPINNETMPTAIIATLQSPGKLQEVCTYKD